MFICYSGIVKIIDPYEDSIEYGYNINVNNFTCDNAVDISECTYNVNVSTCNHLEDLHVKCKYIPLFCYSIVIPSIHNIYIYTRIYYMPQNIVKSCQNKDIKLCNQVNNCVLDDL